MSQIFYLGKNGQKYLNEGDAKKYGEGFVGCVNALGDRVDGGKEPLSREYLDKLDTHGLRTLVTAFGREAGHESRALLINDIILATEDVQLESLGSSEDATYTTMFADPELASDDELRQFLKANLVKGYGNMGRPKMIEKAKELMSPPENEN